MVQGANFSDVCIFQYVHHFYGVSYGLCFRYLSTIVFITGYFGVFWRDCEVFYIEVILIDLRYGIRGEESVGEVLSS